MYWTNYFDTMNSYRDIERLQRNLNRLFTDFQPGPQHAFPAVNIWTNENSAIVTAELPGLKHNNINLSLTDQNLVIEGIRNHHELKEGENVHRQERIFGDFKRSIQLPFPINTEKVNASFKNGVLTITLPRAEEDKPRKISIQSA
jgi:HSP20 family protein